MGAANSKIDEDKALQLCRERKKFVRQALDGRCSLAAAHVTYIHSLRNTGTALRKFVEPEAPIESSLYTSTSATPEPLALTEKSASHSHFSFSSPSLSQRVDVAETTSPSPSPPPPSSTRFQAHHMKFRGNSSQRVEEKPVVPIIGTVTSSSTPTKSEASPFEAPVLPPGTPPWDYFGLFHPIDDQFSGQEEKGMNNGLENGDDVRKVREEEGIPELEDEDGDSSFHERGETEDSEDEFDEPSADTLVRRFENLNRVHDHGTASGSPTVPSARSVASETEFLNGEKGNSPDLAPLKSTPSVTEFQTETKKAPVKEDVENQVASKDFFSSIKDIEYLFIKASESGRELPRMLEANKLHFRPILPGKQRGSVPSTFFSACFSCGEEKSQVQEEEPAQNGVKYLTWHRTTSSRSSSSRTPLGANSKDDVDDFTSNLFDNFCMNSGSHASTLDRLYAWERKLSDEVKASQIVRKEYDSKCKILRELESNGESSYKIDKVRAVVKDLHSRIKVAIHRINSISDRIEELRDRELQPQLEELIQGLSRMWEVMFECHKLQYRIISVAIYNSNTKLASQSESRRQVTLHLEGELSFLCSSFTKWITSQKSYLQAINGWLMKCMPRNEQKTSKRNRRNLKPPSSRQYGPPIYTTCDVWLEKLGTLPTEKVSDSIKGLAAETSRLLPRLEKNQGKSGTGWGPTPWKGDPGSESSADLLRHEAPEEMVSGFDRFRSSLVEFLSSLNSFAESSTKMYVELEKEIEDSKRKYELRKSQS